VRRTECLHEPDAFEAASLGQWPDRTDDELRAHVGTCAICAEVIAVTLALQEDRREIVRNAPILPAQLVWWRAERRAREDAARAATRPIALAHLVAVACAGAAALGLFGGAFGWLHAWIGVLGESVAAIGAASTLFPDLATLVQWGLPLAIGLAAWLVLAQVAVYLTVVDD
jgi:hypothetical protein